jgi:hypothetical protein
MLTDLPRLTMAIVKLNKLQRMPENMQWSTRDQNLQKMIEESRLIFVIKKEGF